MSLLKKNIAANYAGNVWQAIMSLAFVPLYIKFMGIESYGLIGVFATIQGTFYILDMGLSPTLTREMARLSVLQGREQDMRNLVRSLEVIYWCIAIFIGIVTTAILPFIAHYWVKPDKLSAQTIVDCFRIMGVIMVLQWPASLYSGGLMGLQRQVLLNVINVGMSTLRGVGAVLILWLISPTIQAFFLWQIIVSITNSCLLALFLWRSLANSGERASFQKQLVVEVWRFAAGMTAIAISATILTQMSQIILSSILTLEMFGYYTLAGVVAWSLFRLTGPLFSAIYPRFTQLVSLGDQDGLRELYHKGSQLMSVLILPVTVVVAIFSHEIMLLWTRNPVTAEKTHLLVSVLICGCALNGMMNMPGGLLLAHGNTRLLFFTNVIAIIVLVPLTVFMADLFGALGGAIVWVIVNSSYVIFQIHFIHRLVLPAEKWRWYWQDVSLPLTASLVIAVMGRLFMGGNMSEFMTVSYLTIIAISTIGATAVVTPITRTWLFDKLSHFKMFL